MIISRKLHIKGVKRYIFVFLINKVLSGTSPKFFEIKRKLLLSIGCKIGENTKIVGPLFFNQPFCIGKNCWIGKNLVINGDGLVVIGNNCDIAPEVTFLTGGHQIGNHNRRAGKGNKYSIVIKDGCWIGARSTIVGSSIIDSGVVVASCACVVRNVPSDVLVGGVPAKIIKRL